MSETTSQGQSGVVAWWRRGEAPGRDHDYTRTTRTWGHDYVFRPYDGGQRASMTGWGEGLRRGDVLRLDHDGGRVARYRIVGVEYYRDPPDMWRCEAVFVGREHGPVSPPPTEAERVDAFVRSAITPEPSHG